MSALPKVTLPKPPSSNFDLSRKSRFSAAPGVVYPVLVEELLPGDVPRLKIDSLVKTYPLLAPLLGSFKLQFDVFFAPMKNYVRSMHSNTTNFDPTTETLPTFRVPVVPGPEFAGGGYAVPAGSLWDFLGFPPGFQNGTDSDLRFNSLPALSYWDICRNYYADPQSENLYYFNGGTPFSEPSSVLLSDLAGAYQTLLDSNATKDTGSIPTFKTMVPTAFGGSMAGGPTPFDGLCCRCYSPDLNTAWLNSTKLQTLRLKTRVSTAASSPEQNGFTVDQLRTANKLTRYLEKTLVSGGRYDDYVKANFAVSTRRDLMYPEFLGSTASDVLFEDVVSTSNVGRSSAESTGGLGDLGGRGYGYLNSRLHSFRASSNGYLFVMMSLVPRVDYYQGLRPYLRRTEMAHIFAPDLDGLGFEPRMAYSLSAVPPLALNGTPTKWTSGTNPFVKAVGSQPAWSDYMSSVNELHGDFTSTLRYWVNARNFMLKSSSSPDSKATAFVAATHIFPSLFNNVFSNASPYGSNFLIQCRFDLKMRRPISKRLMPTL